VGDFCADSNGTGLNYCFTKLLQFWWTAFRNIFRLSCRLGWNWYFCRWASNYSIACNWSRFNISDKNVSAVFLTSPYHCLLSSVVARPSAARGRL